MPVFTKVELDLKITEWIMEIDYDDQENEIVSDLIDIDSTTLLALKNIVPFKYKEYDYELLELVSANTLHVLSAAVQYSKPPYQEKIVQLPLSFKAQTSIQDGDKSEVFIRDVVQHWQDEGLLQTKINIDFLTSLDSQVPEQAGILGGIVGSIIMLILAFAISFPLGVGTAIFFTEFLSKHRSCSWLIVNVNNLAAVPSIIFGVLGLTIFINYFGIPRASPLIGGIVLALMIIPVVIVTGMASLKAIPKYIDQAAYSLGANKIQLAIHHKLPLALPGMLTGSIIGVARALGETSPLLLIGMLAYISDLPESFSDSITALPVLIFLWSDHPEQLFSHKAAAAIIVLLVMLLMLNSLAIYLRRKFEYQL